jgi:taurine dioxygenase
MATTTTTGTEPRPGSFRLPGYSIAVGPFSHLAEERDRLSALQWRHFEASPLGSTVGA